MSTASLVACTAVLLFAAGNASAQTTATYTLYGNGCAGSGAKPGGVVVPQGYDQQYGNSANRYPFCTLNMHYMQSHDKAELPPTALIRGFNLRNRANYAQAAYLITMDLYTGYTNNAARSLVTTFASNWTGTPTKVFSGNLNVPSVAAQNDPKVWTLKIPFTVPFIFTQARGNFLWECVTTTGTLSTISFFDSVSSAAAQTCRMWANTSSATTGSLGSGYGLVIGLDGPGTGGAIVNLSNTGVPAIGKTFSVDFSGAVANSAAILWLGAQQLNIGLGSALPGCSLYTSLDVILGSNPTGTTGTGGLKFTLPNSQNLVGIQFYNQWMVIDPAANTLGVVLSGGGAAKIGT
ncbi:MAG: hypothetical protein KDC95_23540 [Planctomycetes bacterium]|nr:hypothetical protein [Planctomycetota bacterium]